MVSGWGDALPDHGGTLAGMVRTEVGTVAAGMVKARRMKTAGRELGSARSVEVLSHYNQGQRVSAVGSAKREAVNPEVGARALAAMNEPL